MALFASNDDARPGEDVSSWLSVTLTAGTTYSIRIRGFSDLVNQGPIVLWVLGRSPANDDFFNAVAISGYRMVTGNNTGASFQPGERDFNNLPRNSVWWKFQAPATGPVRINTFGTGFDSVLHVYVGNNLIGVNDDAGNSGQSELVFNATAGTTYHISVSGYSISSFGPISLTVAPGGTGTANVVAAVTPVARATTVNTEVTAFATMLNAGTSVATGCRPQPPPSGGPVALVYHSRGPTGVLGRVNGPMNIPAGGRQDFLMTLTPTAAATTNFTLVFGCTNTNPAPSHAGLNTFLLTAVSGAPPADMIATTATVAGGGIMNVPLNGTGFASIAAKNIGAAASMQMRLSASAIGAPAATLPVTMTVCRTNPATGACLSPPAAPPINFSAAAGATVTFSAFLKSNGTAIPFDPAKKRLFMNFFQGATAVGSTSVAVRTVAGGGGGAALMAAK